MPQRRSNDSQVERLLAALKTDLSYRQDLAARIAKKEGIKYASAMRRLQRYITEAGEKRSFIRAPVAYQREVRQDYRERERQEYERRARERQLAPEHIDRREGLRIERELYEEEDAGEDEGEFDTYDVHLNDLRAVISYHDGNLKDAARALGLSSRGEQLLDFQLRADLADTQTNVLRMKGGGEIEDGIRGFLNNVDAATAQELQDFADIFFNRPDWQIGVMLEDLRAGGTTFADWFDAWESDGFDSQAENSEYWRVWRAAYARAMA